MLRPQHCNAIRDLMDRYKIRWGIRVYRYANVGNHLHLLIKAPTKRAWQGFIRQLSGAIAMRVTGARKGHAIERSAPEHRGFWDHLVYTRIVRFGRDFLNVAQYVCKNLWEGQGVPVRKLMAQGFRLLEISEDGLFLVPLGFPSSD